MPKGYPKSRFEIIDQTQIPDIRTNVATNPACVIMAAYTSDKGSEDWELMYGLTNFTETKGGISFTKHGQAQLLVAEVLRNGGYVFGKRMVSSDAALANITIKARVVPDGDKSLVYIYKTSTNARDFNNVTTYGYDNFNIDDDGVDFPLFTIAAIGRGVSNISFRVVPEYTSSKSSSVMKYTFEVWENSTLLENIMFTMNPDVVMNNISQSLQYKINNNSKQVQCKIYEDGIYGLVRKLLKTTKTVISTGSGSTATTTVDTDLQTLINADFINGVDHRGNNIFSGLITKDSSTDDTWSANMPTGIEVVNLSSTDGIHLDNGSYGTSGNAPILNTNEYTKLLLGAWGDTTRGDDYQYDPVIYDLDAYKPDAIIDCNFDVSVKNAIINLCDIREDVVFLADLGTDNYDMDNILSDAESVNNSRFCAKYHNFFNIIDPYTKKEITVTMPFLLANRLVKHVSNGVGRPFAGLANNIYFPEIIRGTINFLPVNTPGEDQKQKLADAMVNYISYYDGTPVMETMYTSNDEYTQLSFLHNILAIQEVIKAIRSRCPRTRYTFLDGSDLEEYLADANAVVKQYSTNFRHIELQYMADELYESNNIFYATIVVIFRNFIQEEYYKVIAINN